MGAFAHGDDGVDEDLEIGSRRDALDGVGCCGVVGGVVGCGGRCEVSACGEADNSDAFRVDFPTSGIGANGLDGALRVSKGNEGVSFWESVFEDDAGDAVLVEPFGDTVAFCSGDEAAVAAAWADDEGGAIGVFGMVNGEGGISGNGGAGAGGRFSGPERLFGGGRGFCRDEGEGKDGKEGQEGAGFHGEVDFLWAEAGCGLYCGLFVLRIW